ncbi:MAG: N-acetylglutamate synthase [Chloroflexota bacterium]|nr:N-acetylglutamate synthase [Chloroflexota bacterium]
MTPPIDSRTIRRLLKHEAQVHAIPGRELRDLGDALLLHDPTDPEPFWNRLEAIGWPSEPTAFDQRLSEMRILFASLGRQPHIWLAPPHDEPADLEARLAANGFEDMGKGLLMIARDDEPARNGLGATPGADVTVERRSEIVGHTAALVADEIVTVLFDAFAVAEARRANIVAETMASLGDARFMHYLVRRDGEAVAVARSATFDGLTYLSSIGTVERARGFGFGRLVTASALKDALEAGSEWVHLGVFADNPTAIALYERLGFVAAMDPGPDMVLVR